MTTYAQFLERKTQLDGDCGLGKTPMQLAWADLVAKRAVIGRTFMPTRETR